MSQIDGKTYFDIVEQKHPYDKFPSHITISIIRKRFCSPMTALSLCTHICEANCGTSIKAINTAMYAAVDINTPAGLLTHICRSECATRAERAYEASVYTDKDLIGIEQRSDINPFIRLIDTLEDTS